MKLYQFTLSTGKSIEVLKKILEVEEKPKTYIKRGAYTATRILKSDIGILSGYDNSTLYLLEDDEEKAKSIFIELLKNRILREKQNIENTIKRCNECIEKYEKGILELTGTN